MFKNIWNHIKKTTLFQKFVMRTVIIALPYGWHLAFFLVPFLIVLKISFSENLMASLPYSNLCTWLEGTCLQIRLSFASYAFIFEDSIYVDAYLESIKIASLATLTCMCLGYPMAYGLTKVNKRLRIILMMLLILPFWTSFLIRVYAWMGLINTHGLINSLLLKLHIISEPLQLLHNNVAVCFGIVYAYLPFMILPIFVSLEKIDPHLLEAAYDLGCKPWQAFLKITWPLSIRGVIGGSMLVLIPAIGEFVIPELLGGLDNVMIGRVLWSEFFMNRDWPLASALAICMLLVLVLPIMIFQRFVQPDESPTNAA